MTTTHRSEGSITLLLQGDEDDTLEALRRLAAAVTAVALLVAATATSATAQQKQHRGVTNIVLVHGARADA